MESPSALQPHSRLQPAREEEEVEEEEREEEEQSSPERRQKCEKKGEVLFSVSVSTSERRTSSRRHCHNDQWLHKDGRHERNQKVVHLCVFR